MSGGDVAADPGALAARVVDLVGGRAEVAVTATHVRSGLTRFANSFIHQNVGDESVVLHVQVAVDGRSAAASTTDLGEGAVARLVEATLTAAAHQPVDDEWPGLAPPTPLVADPADRYDDATAAAGPAERADVVAAFVAAGDGLEAAGYCETEVTHGWFVNSAGQQVHSAATVAALDGIHRADGSDGCGSGRSVRLAELDGSASGRSAAATARRGTRPVQLPPGRYEVLLEPRSVAYLLDFLTVYGFNARAVAEGRSFVSPGEVQFDERLSLWDDATDPRHDGLAYDAEGTPRRRLDLVDAGRVLNVTHDRRSASKAGGGTLSSGHAVPGGASVGAIATHVLVSGTGAAAPSDLVAGVGRGLLVKDFWYTRVLDPRSLVVTGLTRNGVFLVEDGEIGPAVGNLRFTQSPVAAMGPGQVLGVGDDAVLAPGGLHVSWHHVPSLHLADWSFTGNASG